MHSVSLFRTSGILCESWSKQYNIGSKHLAGIGKLVLIGASVERGRGQVFSVLKIRFDKIHSFI